MVGAAGEVEFRCFVSLFAAELSSLFGGLNQINWDAFSPEKLKMDLKYDEMSEEELQKVVSAFVSLGLIGQEEAERFARFIVDPELRDMLQRVSDNWSEVMQKIVSDPDYLRFLKDLQSRNLDEEKLATIVGLKHGLAGAVADAEAAMEEESAAAGEGSE